jgi:hypothetical protein
MATSTDELFRLESWGKLVSKPQKMATEGALD